MTDYFSKLQDKQNTPHKIRSIYLYILNNDDPSNPGNFNNIIGIDDIHLSDVSKKSLEILENNNKINDFWVDLKWKVLAYLTVQDLFDTPNFDIENTSTIFTQWYYYYEAKYILIEALLSGLNGFFSSVGMLLRLFLEFSMLQNFSYLKIKNNRNYNIDNDFIKIDNPPRWSKLANGCLPNDNFSKPLKDDLLDILKDISNVCAHPYKSIYSPRRTGSFLPEQTFQSLFFGSRISEVLEYVLRMYYINFPMALHPVDIQKKFGFNYPVGIFIEYNGGTIIRRSIKDKEYKRLFNYTKNTDRYADLMSFYNSQKDMNDDDIKSTWNEQDVEFVDTIAGHCKIMAKMRVIHETLSLYDNTNKQ